MKHFLPAAPRRQLGFSLIELMVAMTVGLFVTSGLVGIVLNMKSTFNAQDGLAQLQDSERLVFTMLTTTIQSGGYFVDPAADTVATALPATGTANPDGTTFAAGQSITGTTGSGGSSDTIDVRYQTANLDGLMNCKGGTNTSSPKQVYVNSFAVNDKHELTCSVNGDAAVAMVSNVSRLSTLYGVDTNADGSVDTYLSAADVSKNGLWGQVATVQVTISFMNPLYPTTGPSVLSPPWVQTINMMNKV